MTATDGPPPMPPYSGEGTRCVKCGGEGASTMYIGQAWKTCERGRRGEHLCRECRTCSYGWCEAVVDQGTPPAPSWPV